MEGIKIIKKETAKVTRPKCPYTAKNIAA